MEEALGYVRHNLDPQEHLFIHPLSDLHVGATAHDRKRLETKLQAIQDGGPSHRILMIGDAADTLVKYSKAFEYGMPSPEDELDMFIKLFKPVAAQVDLILPGNHEERITRMTGLDFAAQMAARIGRPDVYRRAAAVVKYKMKDGRSTSSAEFFCHHGYGGGRKAGGKYNKLTDLALLKPDCDVYCAGHTHEYGSRKDSIWLGDPPRKVERLFVSTGSYLGQAKYALDQAYPMTATGTPVIQLSQGRRRKGGRLDKSVII